MKKILPWLLCFSCSSLFAGESNDNLSIDRVVTNAENIMFANEPNIKPKAGNFSLLHYVLMSNEQGERWAVATIKNLSSGNRRFEHGHLMALFADGQRKIPEPVKQNFKGDEVLSLTLNFSESKFPILSLYMETRN